MAVRNTVNRRACPLKRKWFILPLPLAWLLAGLLFVARDYGAIGIRSLGDALGFIVCVAFWGTISFPVGLPLFWTWGNPEPFVTLIVPIILLGYLLYIGLSVYGAIRRSWIAMLALCVLLALNLIGCQADTAIGLVPIGR